jgi:hypothetical protein
MAENTNYFINPAPSGPDGNFTQDKTYVVGEYLPLNWTTNYAAISLVLYQNQNDTPTWFFSEQAPPHLSCQWIINISGFNLDNGEGELDDTYIRTVLRRDKSSTSRS